MPFMGEKTVKRAFVVQKSFHMFCSTFSYVCIHNIIRCRESLMKNFVIMAVPALFPKDILND